MQIGEYIWLYPWLFLAILPIIGFVWWNLRFKRRRKASLQLSSFSGLTYIGRCWKQYGRRVLFVMRILALTALVFAFARPQNHLSHDEIATEGIDIVLSLDVSSSMSAEDFRPNRLEAAKNLAKEFIKSRANDRIGLVVFSSESFTQCPITIDHSILNDLFEGVHSGMVEDGTAIGMGLATAVDRLKDSKAKSKVIILMTDGVNNTGLIDPQTGAELAKTYGIRIYTIGVGSYGMAPMPVQTPFGKKYVNQEVMIDEAMMRKIATQTGGQYFRATGNSRLKDIYAQIDKLEKTKIEVSSYRQYKEEYLIFALIAALLLLLEFVLRHTILRTFP